ncbi:MAG: DUF885 domain-containing protein, partial [Pyrinomonadaceae bacterium]
MITHFILLSSILVTASIITPAQSAVQDTSGAKNDTTKSLHSLFDDEWEYQMEQHPVMASLLGDRRWNNIWEDVSRGAIERRHNHGVGTLQRLNQINRNELSLADQLNFDLFKQQYEISIEGYKYHWFL